jgi:hypothetical protein
MLHPTVVAIYKMLFNAPVPTAVAELECAVHGTDTTADDAKPSPPFTGKCGDYRPATWY